MTQCTPSSLSYRLVPTSNGVGVVAARQLPAGELIFHEQPLIRFPAYIGTEDIESKFGELSPDDQKRYLQLYDGHKASNKETASIMGIARTNALPLGWTSDPLVERGIFLQGSRFNHSCLPNAVQKWNEKKQHMGFYATRAIEPNEEITISYIGADSTSQERQKMLESGFGFKCQCCVCSLPLAELKKSDFRRQRINILDDALLRVLNVPLAKKQADELIQLYRDEGLTNPNLFSRTYYDMFSLSFKQDYKLLYMAFEYKILASDIDCPEVQKWWYMLPSSFRMNVDRCFRCGVAGSLKCCGRCGQVKYCNKQHQLEHWKQEHRAVCQQK